MKKIYLAAIALLSLIPFALRAQNAPLSLWGTGLDGSIYQQSVFYSDATNGLLIEGPLNSSGVKLPISFSWRGGNITPLVLHPNGNIGIGTANPQGYLDIYSTSNPAATPVISVRSNFHVVGNYGMIRFGDYTQTTNYQKGAIIYESVAGSARGKLHIALENTDGSGSVSLTDARLTVLSNGNVGIGTTNPDEKLTVNGTIHTTEVKVNLSIPAPDYVFEPAYKLPALADVKAFVDKNHHLPEIPSAAEMAKNGLDLGAMNTQLLKKVEELTLYLIEKDKKDARLLKNVEQLQRQIKAMSAKQTKTNKTIK